jgi:tol-pal system protein YbgF
MTSIRFIITGLVVVAGFSLAPLSHALAQDEAGTESAAAETQSEAPQSDIDKRLRRIEDEIIDMRAMIGALQSFTTSEEGTSMPGDISTSQAPAASFAPEEDVPADRGEGLVSGPSDAQISQLEIQIQALSAQLGEAVRRLGRLEQAVGLTPGESADTGGDPAAPAQDPVSGETASEGVVPGFGTTTVEPPEDTGETRDWASLPDSSEADGAGDPEAQALFTQAYDALLAQDYAAAREGFEAFIEAHPDDPLVNNARYWLADAAFAEGDYVAAANNFVKVYNTAPRGEKSEETLLKLAVTLRRMDRSKAACDALSRLEGRLDGKPEAFRERVKNERSRSGCS